MIKHDHIFHYPVEFQLESGTKLPGFQLKYTTLGQLNKERDNAIWVCHALTGSSDFADWWHGLFSEGSPFDPNRYFIICANSLGGCYGSTGPLSINPISGHSWFHDFPLVTNRDIVQSFDRLRENLGLTKIHTLIGGSLGGQQVLEWAIQKPDVFERIIPVACNAFHSPWGIAINEAQRMAIAADPTWKDKEERAGAEGMKAARAIAMVSFRSYEIYNKNQPEVASEKLEGYRAASYQQYQGAKLANRFNSFSYWTLLNAMDSHHVGRGRGEAGEALSTIKARTLVIGVSSDILFPVAEQEYIAKYIPGAQFEIIQSPYGHDGFLVEFEQFRELIRKFLTVKEYSSLANNRNNNTNSFMSKKLKLGLFGFGCIGQGLYHVLHETHGVKAEIKKICIKHSDKKRSIDASFFTTSKDEILSDPEIDVVVELIDDSKAAFDIVKEALSKGKAVVTANKKMIAENFQELYDLQQKYNQPVLYEGSVCGSIPIIRNLEEYYDNDLISSIEGIFNGSTNYILTEIFDGRKSYADALKKAQELGFAESNPDLDVKGFDPKFKLTIAIAHTFGVFVKPDHIVNFGIDKISDVDLKYARENGYTIKLIARAFKQGNKVYGFVAPQFIETTHLLANVRYEYNAVLVQGAFAEKQIFVGKGAGGYPTGSAVLSDVSALVYGYRYEYKKKEQDHLSFSNDASVDVVVSFTGDKVKSSDFLAFSGGYRGNGHQFLKGKITLERLGQWANDPDISVILEADSKVAPVSLVEKQVATVG